MKTLIIYKSIHQMNTEKVAQVMAEAMNADLLKIEEVNPSMLAEYDLIGFGSGIYYGKHHTSLLEFVASLPEQNKTGFIFSTSGGALKIMHRELRAALVQKGFTIRGEFTCPGFEMFGVFKLIGGFRKGRPNAKDLEKARV
ncbi:MAG: flavodoxin, partial [Methanomicrobiales archaeon]|nr:flavodoxin [Methanomicrobiales archaeon]